MQRPVVFGIAIAAGLAARVLAGPYGPSLVPDGGFEEATTAWAFVGPWEVAAGPDAGVGAGIVAGDAHEGRRALRLDSRDREGEVNANSPVIPVTAGAKYELSAWVRLVAPSASGFKVTVDWLDSDGRHIVYANDWRGSAAGHEWIAHTADVTAPDNAAGARILLGVQPGGVMLFDEVSIRLVGPRLALTAFGPSEPVSPPGSTPLVRVTIANTGGQPLERVTGRLLTGDNELGTFDVGALDAAQSRTFECSIRVGQPGTLVLTAAFAAANAEDVRASSTVLVADMTAKPALTVDSGRASLRFMPAPEGLGPAEVVVTGPDGPLTVAVLRSVAALMIDSDPGPVLLQPALSRDGDVAHGIWEGEACDVALAVRPSRPGWFDIECELTARRDLELRSLVCPEVYVGVGPNGDRKDGALFPGLEYLTADEVSSGDYAIAKDLAARSVPHPNKVTVPLMAVARDGWATGITWDPLQTWDGTRDRPTATFSSPNALEGQHDHLLALSVPDIPDYVRENERIAFRPFPVARGERIRLRSKLFVLPAPTNVCDVMPEWYGAHSGPHLSGPPPDLLAEWEHSVAAQLTQWDEDAKGWRTEAHRPFAFEHGIAMRLLNYGGSHEGPIAAEALRQARTATASLVARRGPGALGLNLSLHLGHVVASLEGFAAELSRADAQRPDGSWPFVPGPQNESIGTAGDTDLGICAEPTMQLLRVAELTGDPAALEAGLKGLAFIEEHFRRPAGGETWEVPLHAPNLRAAAMALECGVSAYEITGERKYLDTARYWATAGLPFVYAWGAPDRPAMGGATISVFGSSFWTVPWFGRPVQWVGMVYSQALQRLAPYDLAFPWDELSEAILRSCIGQQRIAEDPGTGNPWPGAFPDSYNLVDGVVAGAWIGPSTIIYSIEQLMALPATEVKLVGRPGERIRVIAPGAINEVRFEGGALTVMIGRSSKAPVSALLTCIGRPAQVAASGAELLEAADLEAVESGWWHDPLRNMLLVKLPPRAMPPLDFTVEGARFAQTTLRPVSAVLVNPGFEEGLSGWSGQGRVLTEGARSGAACLELDARGVPDERQALSVILSVDGGREYDLAAWVRTERNGAGYKVTLDWLDAGMRHIRYDNDWQGKDSPPEWTLHGGRFAAPTDARAARLILGARPGVRLLVDDVSLAPAGAR